MKLCKRCNRRLAINKFGTHPRYSDGLNPCCKICCTKYAKHWRDKNIETRLKYEKDWRDANPDKIAVIRGRFFETNPEAEKQYSTLYRKRHPDRRRVSTKSYRISHKKEEQAYRKAYARKNKAKLNAKAAKRRALLLKATPPWVNLKEIELIYIEAEKLTEITGIEHHVDHFYPLKHKFLSGLHVPANLRITTLEENLSKGNRWPVVEGFD